MSFFTNRKIIEKKVCSKRTIQGGIEKFAVKQTADDILCSKDGLKQQKIDCFMKQKPDSLKSKRESNDGKGLNSKNNIFTKKRKQDETKTDKSHIVIESITLESDSSDDDYHTAPSPLEFNDKLENNNDCDVISSSPIITKKRRKIEKENRFPNCQSDQRVSAAAVSTSLPNLYCKTDKNILASLQSKSCPELPKKLLKVDENTQNFIQNPTIENNLTKDEMANQMLVLDSDFESVQSSSTNFILPNKYSATDLKSNRFKVLSVVNSTPGQKCIEARSLNNQKDVLIQLTNEWADTCVETDDLIHLNVDEDIDCKDDRHLITVNSKANLLVVNPDWLISGTTVSNSLGCLRRAVLSERFKNTEFVASDDVSSVMLVGTIVHSIFQQAVKDKTLQSEIKLKKLARDTVFNSCYISDIVAINSSQEKIFKEVSEYVPQIKKWFDEFCYSSISPSRGKINMNYRDTSRNQLHRYPANVALTEVLDIEENVWSPRYGLKGKIDVTGKFKVKNQQTRKEFETIMPIEIKTGKNSHSMEHHVQVAIYSMFCDERHNQNPTDTSSIPAGLLLYLKSNTTSCQSRSRPDLSGILSLRNQIVHYLTKTVIQKDDLQSCVAPFPDTTTNTRICEMCSQLRNCSLVYKSVDESHSSFASPSKDLASMMNQHVSHLDRDDLEYFKHWMTCIFLEAREAHRKDKRSRFWQKTSCERQSDGNCIAGLKLANSSVSTGDGSSLFLQTFKRPKNKQVTKNVFELNEMVLISGKEPEFIAMASGVVKEINPNFITVETERDFHHYPPAMLYSIDRHVWLSQFAVKSSLSNLSLIMNNDEQCNKLRSLIIKHGEPSFRSGLDFIPRSSKDKVATMLRGLNRTQRQAIKRVLLSNDYTLVVGMPGSGKTTTIVAMIRILLLCNLRVLVTSYTHSAVDNLLLKLIKYKVNFLRLGRSSMVHPSIQPFTEGHLSRDFSNPTQLLELYKKSRVVGCTCLAVTSHLFFSIPGQSRPLFDVCIVDEASQISQPACLSPLMYATRFVLVGDHQQLPPLVVSQEAKDMGADESLFWRLTRHKLALCELTLQYRMNSEIMGLSNHVTYEGRLECAHPSVAKATLQLNSWKQVENKIGNTDPWLVKALNPDTCVIFLDTSEIAAFEEENVENHLEADIITRITNLLIESGCSSANIGIIAPFRKQVQLLEKKLSESSSSVVEVNTVDKYQGRDKSVILLSFVKSKEDDRMEKKGELLSDWRRLNVAITRAKHKLVMVGCVPALQQYLPCKKLLEYMQEHNLITPLSNLP